MLGEKRFGYVGAHGRLKAPMAGEFIERSPLIPIMMIDSMPNGPLRKEIFCSEHVGAILSQAAGAPLMFFLSRFSWGNSHLFLLIEVFFDQYLPFFSLKVHIFVADQTPHQS